MSYFEPRAQWRSFWSYILVTTGAMVGLGNFFQFPFLVTKYGGMFLLFLILSEAFVALPLLFAELLIGRRGKQNPVGSIEVLSLEGGKSTRWKNIGWLCFVVVVLTLAFYSVTAGFPVGYFIDSVHELMSQGATAATQVNLDSYLMTSFSKLEICFVAFLVIAMLVVYRGINRGLEFISCITVPLYLIILVCLAIYTSTRGNFSHALHNLFNFNIDVSVLGVFLVALAFSLLKLKVGMGVMIVYGSYLPYHVSFGRSTLIIVGLDLLVSILSYLVIYPLMLEASPDLFMNGLSHSNVLHVFVTIPYGLVIACLFFFAAILAAWTPIIAMAETAVVTLVERMHISRAFAASILLIVIFGLGTFEIISNLQLQDIELFKQFYLHNLLKNISMDILAPLTALFTVIFAGWIVKRQVTYNELQFKPAIYSAWRFLVCYVSPIALIIVLLTVTILESQPF